MQKSGRNLWLLVLGVMLILLTSCSSYYMVQRVPLTPRDSLYQILEDTSRYVIVHFKNHDAHLFDIAIDKDQGALKGKIEPVSYLHQAWKEQTDDTTYKYSKSDMRPIGEVHLQVDDLCSKKDTQVSFKLNQITSVKEHVADVKRSKSARGHHAVIWMVVVFGVVIAIVYSIQNMSIGISP